MISSRSSALPPVSIVLCTCNGERYLGEQLDSLVVQAGVAEIVVVDDASTDGTWAILTAHAARDPRIRLERNAHRLGVTSNFERAISLARSPWIALSDQDDLWLPGKLARLRAAWDGQSDLIHHASKKFSGSPPVVLPARAGDTRKFHGNDPRRLFYRNSITGHATLMRRGLAQRLMPFPPGVMHDWWLGLGAAALGRVQYVDEFLVLYRIHAQNAFHATGSRWRRARRAHRLQRDMLRAFVDLADAAEPARQFARIYLARLQGAEAGVFSPGLMQFHLAYADVLFTRAGGKINWMTRWRKSFGATLGRRQLAPREEAGDGRKPALAFSRRTPGVLRS